MKLEVSLATRAAPGSADHLRVIGKDEVERLFFFFQTNQEVGGGGGWVQSEGGGLPSQPFMDLAPSGAWAEPEKAAGAQVPPAPSSCLPRQIKSGLLFVLCPPPHTHAAPHFPQPASPSARPAHVNPQCPFHFSVSSLLSSPLLSPPWPLIRDWICW